MAGPRLGRAEAVAARLLRLETRLARAERQLRGALALRGRLRALERRLENGGGAPRVPARRGAAGAGRGAARGPVSPEDVWVQFSEREWRALRGWQRALHRAVLRRNYHMLLPTGKAATGRARAGGPRCPRCSRLPLTRRLPQSPTCPGAPRPGGDTGTSRAGAAGTGTGEVTWPRAAPVSGRGTTGPAGRGWQTPAAGVSLGASPRHVWAPKLGCWASQPSRSYQTPSRTPFLPLPGAELRASPPRSPRRRAVSRGGRRGVTLGLPDRRLSGGFAIPRAQTCTVQLLLHTQSVPLTHWLCWRYKGKVLSISPSVFPYVFNVFIHYPRWSFSEGLGVVFVSWRVTGKEPA